MSSSTSETVATFEESRAEVLRLTGRNYGVVRHLFVQQPRGSASRPSTLGTLVSTRKHRATLLYLLLLTVWPMLSKRREPFEGAFWARLLSTETGPSWTASDVSKAWKDLEGLELVQRTREGRALRVQPRREDGRTKWTPPGRVGKNRRETYFVLPAAFWTTGLFSELSFPALAVLLIVAAETSKAEEAWLTYDHAPDWYGFSPATFKNGTRELEAKGILHRRPETIKAPMSPTGSTTRWWYSLTGAYSSAARAAAQEAARKERAARTKKEAAARRASSEKAIKAKRTRKASAGPERKSLRSS